MNIVYKISFIKRIRSNTPPFYYIGMKTSCDYKHGKVIDKKGICYWGSSETASIKSALQEEVPFVEILFESDSDKDVCEEERRILLSVNAARNFEYFNQTNGTIDWTFHSSEYATYRHKDYNDVYKRLRRDDPLVLDKTYVGTTNGMKFINHPSNYKRARLGKLNRFLW